MSAGVVVLGYGSQPFKFMSDAVKVCGKDAVVDPDVARMAGADFAVGPRAALDDLRQRLEAGSLQAVRQQTAGLLSPEAQRWLANGERGMSSEALFTCLSGVSAVDDDDEHHRTAHPYDPDDFRRCRLMLEACPELETRLSDAAGMSPQWAALVAVWGTLCDTMDAETPNWRNRNPDDSQYAHNTYSLIKQAIGR